MEINLSVLIYIFIFVFASFWVNLVLLIQVLRLITVVEKLSLIVKEKDNE